jgi:hypothetical protein
MSRGWCSTSHAELVGLWIVATATGSLLALLITQILLIMLEPVVRDTADEVLLGGMLGLSLGVGQCLLESFGIVSTADSQHSRRFVLTRERFLELFPPGSQSRDKEA